MKANEHTIHCCASTKKFFPTHGAFLALIDYDAASNAPAITEHCRWRSGASKMAPHLGSESELDPLIEISSLIEAVKCSEPLVCVRFFLKALYPEALLQTWSQDAVLNERDTYSLGVAYHAVDKTAMKKAKKALNKRFKIRMLRNDAYNFYETFQRFVEEGLFSWIQDPECDLTPEPECAESVPPITSQELDTLSPRLPRPESAHSSRVPESSHSPKNST